MPFRCEYTLNAEDTLQGEKALGSGETPVGCVLVYNDQIVGRGMNDTNRSMNVSNRACAATNMTSLITPREPDMPNSLPLQNCCEPIPDLLCKRPIST